MWTEYHPSFPLLLWEPLFLLQRLTLSGFFSFFAEKFQRLCAAIFLCVCYMTTLLLVMPYRRTALNYTAAGAQ